MPLQVLQLPAEHPANTPGEEPLAVVETSAVEVTGTKKSEQRN
jgi:hypothetical protein